MRQGGRSEGILATCHEVMTDERWSEFLERSAQLDARAREVQENTEGRVAPDEIDGLVSEYQEWYAECLAALPDEFPSDSVISTRADC